MNRRTVATVALPVAAIAIALGLFAIIQDRLPEQVATHWGPGGAADGFMSKAVLPYFLVGFSVLLGGLFGLIAYSVRASMVGLRFLRAMPLALVSFILSLNLILAMIQIDATEAPALPGWVIPLALVVGLAGWGLAAWVVGPDDPVLVTNAPAPAGGARINLPDGQTVVWSGRTPVAAAIPIVATVVVVLGLVIGWFAGWFILAILGPVAALLVGSSMYRITVGPNGLRVAGLFFGLPRVGVPLNQMASAEVGTVNAWSFGGWGIRLGANGESAVITRSGPALIVRRTDGAALRVSLDHPEQAVAVLTTLMDRR
jgi:hypothetical protein